MNNIRNPLPTVQKWETIMQQLTHSLSICLITLLLASSLHANLNYERLNQETFTTIYRLNVWGDHESASGPGSSKKQTVKIRNWLPQTLKSLGIQTLLDAPSGDFNWMKEIDLSFLECYIGVDIVPELVLENAKRYANSRTLFLHMDITKDPLPRAQAVLCRDCLTHLSFSDIWAALKNFKKSGAKYLLISTYPNREVNLDLQGGNLMHLLRYRPLNFQKAPFHFPAPRTILLEENTEGNGHIADKSIAVWEIKDLPID